MDSQVVVTNQVDATTRKRYKLLVKSWKRNYSYIEDDGTPLSQKTHHGKTPLFVVDNSSFTRHKPDVTLHAGADMSSASPAVACSFIPGFGRHFRLGLGDAAGLKGDMTWEEMTQVAVMSMKSFSWSMDVPGLAERPRLMWKRTTKHAVDGRTANTLSSRNWKLVRLSTSDHEAEDAADNNAADNNDDDNNDDDSVTSDEIEYEKHRVTETASSKLPLRPKGDILAVFTSEKGFTHVCGILQINVEWGTQFEYMVLISLVAIYERLMRARQSSGAGAGT